MTISARAGYLCGWMPIALAIGCLIGPQAASAAPFCLRNLAVPPQCLFYDPNTCQRESIKQGGWCEPNPAETHIATGAGQYCLVTGGGAGFCAFLSRESCAAEANRLHGVCYHDEARTTGVPDPYAYSGGPSTAYQAAPETPETGFTTFQK
jgi:hypothetical protein